MTPREEEAKAAGLRDLTLLRLHGENEPLSIVMAALRGKFGHHATAFAPDIRTMLRAEFRAARGEYLAKAARDGFRQREEAETARVYDAMARKHA